ncbi:peroxiredoxin [Bdellovibrionota bacterium FG-1]
MMGKSLLLLGWVFLVFVCMALTPGDSAPDFSVMNQDGKVIHLSDYKGKPVILYFYPKDDTPGCTREACAFRDQYKRFSDAGAVILGVSTQDQKSHRAFRAKHHLPFDLLTDPQGKLAEIYGIKKMPVIRLFMRQTVLIAGNGKIIRVYPDVDPSKHADELMKDLEDYAVHAGK